MSLTTRVEDSAAALGSEALIAAWTGDRPRPEHWIETGGLDRARSALEVALREGAGTILVTGPSGHGKTTLLRSFWHAPPSGFATVFVPRLDVSQPQQIAARILATTRTNAVHDAAGALSRMLRAQALRGSRPVLLVDDLHDVEPATLAKLLALAAGSRVDVSMVAASSQGEALDERMRALPRPIRNITVDDPWTRADAQRLIARIGASLPIGADDLLAAIDVSEALRTSDGNPRLVRTALAAQLRQLNLPRTVPIISPPAAPTLAQAENASSEPAAPEPEQLAPAPVLERAAPEPAPVLERAAPEPEHPMTSPPEREHPIALPPEPPPRRFPGRPPPQHSVRSPRSRAQRRALSARTRLGIAGALVASVAFVLTFDRVPAIAAWTSATASAYLSEAAHWIRAWEPPEMPSLRVAEAAAQDSWDRLRGTPRLAAEWTRAEPLVAPVSAEAPEPVAAEAAAPVATEVPVPPIRVAVNSDPWSNVEVDGVAAGSTPFTIELAPGLHRFRAAMADGSVVEQEFEVSAERNRVVLQGGRRQSADAQRAASFAQRAAE